MAAMLAAASSPTDHQPGMAAWSSTRRANAGIAPAPAISPSAEAAQKRTSAAGSSSAASTARSGSRVPQVAEGRRGFAPHRRRLARVGEHRQERLDRCPRP